MDIRPGAGLRGRGAVTNEAGRFETSSTSVFDDGWDSSDPSPPPLPTIIQPELTRRILSSNSSPDLPFSRSINPYKGCEHGCIYCFARPTHAFLGLSPGLDFESRIFSKPRAASLLRRELSSRSYRPEVIVLGANTDPYQPAEGRLGISRQILEVLDELSQPICIITKSSRILRDRDILRRMAQRGLVHVNISVTSLNSKLARRMEPRASSPTRRLATIRELSSDDVPVGVLSSPMIPALNDAELEAILDASAEAGARSAGYILLRLPREVAGLFSDWLEHHYPDRKDHVLDLLRSTRKGALYRDDFGQRMVGTGPYAALLRRRFAVATRRLGLDTSPPQLNFEHFNPKSSRRTQLSLF